MTFFLVRLLIALMLIAQGKTSRPGDFKIIGPGGGGAMFHPTISPHDPDTVLIACDMSGAYITHDAGRTWRMFNLRGVVDFFVFDPLDRDVIYAHATGLWRSTDRGETWNLIYPKPSALKSINMSSDHADEELIADPDPLGNITAMAIDPYDSNVFYVAAHDSKKQTSALFISRNGGQDWTYEGTILGRGEKIWVNSSSPNDDRIIFIAGESFISKKNGSGAVKLSGPPAAKFVDVSMGFRKNGQAVIYIIGDDSAFASDDEGKTWRRARLGRAGGKMRAIATSLHNPDTAYLSYRDLPQGNIKWLGVAKTVDAGRTWKLVWK